jgi:hypothetical protein
MLNTITDMLEIANIRNVSRYFKTPSPQTLQAIQSAPKEPDAMTLAAKAQFEKVKSDAAQALGDQQLRQEKQAQDDAFRHAQLREKTAYDQQKLELERAKARATAGQDDSGRFDPIEAAKVGVDLHKTNLDAAMRERKLQADFAINAAKIEQQREASQLQAQTAQAAAQNNDSDGST